MASSCPHCDADGNHSTTHDSRIQQIKDWLATCLDTHEACRWEDPSPPLPTRVLQLDLGDGTDDVRLVDGQDKQGKYAALSYSWGPNPDAISKTTSANLAQNQSRIALGKLNLLFREAITILRSLGVAYLWVDALCIVQDSRGDWEHEASLMRSVYSGAYLTVSASASTSPDDFPVPQQPITTPDKSLRTIWQLVEHGALTKRGWCLQERCLSRRIVHLGYGQKAHWAQMHWECPGAACDEHVNESHLVEAKWFAGKRIMLGPRGFLNDDLPGRGPYRLWYSILNNYGNRSLSFEKDRIPALSGLIDLFGRATGDSMVSGLWRADLPRGLIWSSGAAYAREVERDFGAEAYGPATPPSWSWLGAPRFQTLTQVRSGAHAASFRILSLDEASMTITLQGTLYGFPPAWIVSGLHRVICGPYDISTTGISWDFTPESIGRCMAHDGLSDGECSGDSAEASAASMIWVLVIVEPEGKDNGWGLVVVRAADHPEETYRRVGLVRIFPLGWFEPDLYSDFSVHHVRQEPRAQTIKLR